MKFCVAPALALLLPLRRKARLRGLEKLFAKSARANARTDPRRA